MHDLKARLIDSQGALEGIAAPWRALQRRASPRNVFLTWEWLSAWWRFEGGKNSLYVLAIEDAEGELVGVAPLMLGTRQAPGLARLREARFLGTGAATSDYLEFLSEAGREDAVAACAAAYLFEHREAWDLLRLEEVPEASPALRALRREFVGSHLWAEARPTLCPYLPVSGSWEAFLNSQSRNFREKLRYKRRVLMEKLNGRLVVCESPEEVTRALEALFEFNPRRWREQGERSAFMEEGFRQFHREVAQRFLASGWLDLSFIEVDDKIVAVLYSFRYANKIFFYNSGFHPCWARYGPGNVLLGYGIERAFADGVEEFDFLGGTSPYKYNWTNVQRRALNLMIIRRSARTLGWQWLRSARRGVGRMLPEGTREMLKARRLR
jgi:CelD/BcsL family acetyltransferase involved in cellulose biosynthesis